MPRREEHDLFELIMLGRLTGITPILDMYSDEMQGWHQRKGHDEETIMQVFAMTNDPDVIVAGYLHLWLDEMWSKSHKQIKEEKKQNGT